MDGERGGQGFEGGGQVLEEEAAAGVERACGRGDLDGAAVVGREPLGDFGEGQAVERQAAVAPGGDVFEGGGGEGADAVFVRADLLPRSKRD